MKFGLIKDISQHISQQISQHISQPQRAALLVELSGSAGSLGSLEIRQSDSQ